jgi:hypothetical protein
MQTERQQRAASYRAQESQQSQQIKAEADRKVTVITAEAQPRSEQTRGEGDGEGNRIFADAYSADPDFFGFYRSMQAYENSFANGRARSSVRSRTSSAISLPPRRRRKPRRPRLPRPSPRRRRKRTEMRDFRATIGWCSRLKDC